MIIRYFLAALVAGLLVGLVMTPVQYAGVVPLIKAAERYEAGTHDHHAALGGATAQGAHGGGFLVTAAEAHALNDGAADEGSASLFQSRFLGTLFADLVAGGGFALMLMGASLTLGRQIDRRNGLYWGLAGFAAVTLAPALGLAPELPAMPAADLLDRQIWWVATAVLTAAAIGLFAFRRTPFMIVLGLVCLIAPHLVGAPQPADLTSPVPPTLAAEFAVASLVTGAIFWVLLGLGVGSAMERLTGGATR